MVLGEDHALRSLFQYHGAPPRWRPHSALAILHPPRNIWPVDMCDLEEQQACGAYAQDLADDLGRGPDQRQVTFLSVERDMLLILGFLKRNSRYRSNCNGII